MHVLGLLIILFTLSAVAMGILSTGFWIWMIVDCAVNEPSKGSNKVVWVLIIVFTHVIGALIYFFARRPKRVIEAVMSKAGGAPTSPLKKPL